MSNAVPLTPAELSSLSAQVNQRGMRGAAEFLGLHRNTISRGLRGQPVAPHVGATLQTRGRNATRVRTADDYAAARSLVVHAPVQQSPTYSWSLEMIRAARDAQLAGDFAVPVRLAEAMGSDDAIFNARTNRVAPQNSVATVLEARGGTRGESVMRRAKDSVIVTRPVIAGIHETMVDHGVAIGYNTLIPSEDGTRVDLVHDEWPLEFVRWDRSRRKLLTKTEGAGEVEITHGDGIWTVYRKFKKDPWTKDACIVPGCLIYAAHANGLSDLAGASRSHGLAKVLGELPDGFDLIDEDGNLSADARAFLALLQSIMSGDSIAGIKPFGAKAEFIANQSSAWQVFTELLTNREKAAARVYQGTDASLGSVGGAPGVDIAALFGVATTRLQGDFLAIEDGLATGVYDPWTAINEGDTRYAPRLRYQIPDPDSDAKSKEQADKYTRLLTTVESMRKNRMTVDQAVVDQLAADFGLNYAPKLAPATETTSTLVLAPTDVARVTRVREARAANALPPLGDKRDDMMISQLDAAPAIPAPVVPA